MSENNHYRAFEITDKGFDLRQTAIAGGDSKSKANSHGRYKIDFTRGAIGQGRPEPDTDIYYMTELVSHAADVPIKESYAENKNHIMVIVIDGTAFEDDVTMTEIGIYARLIDADTGAEVIPEILYGYTYTDKFDYIPAGENYNLYREIAFNTVLSRKGQFEIVYDKNNVYATHKEIEDMISGLASKNVSYDNSESGLDNVTMQGAIDSLKKLHDDTMDNIEYEPVPDDIPDGGDEAQDKFKGVGFLSALWNRLTGIIKGITGKANWWQKPAMNIEEITTQLNNIAQESTPIEYPLVYADNFSNYLGGSLYGKTKEGVAFVYLNMISSVNLVHGTKIGYLPTGFRPATTLRFIVFVTPTVAPTSETLAGTIFLDINGDIIISNVPPGCTRIHGVVSFFCA